jgi:membrane associated rhomboid family serine protease
MHGSWSHLIFNMLALWMFGAFLKMYGDQNGSSFFIYCVGWVLHFFTLERSIMNWLPGLPELQQAGNLINTSEYYARHVL